MFILSKLVYHYIIPKQVKRGLQLVFLSLGFALLAWKAVLPCYVAIGACYVSQVVCKTDRSIFSASMNTLCKLALMSHSPNHLLQALPSHGGGANILCGYTSWTHGLPYPSFGSLSESIFGYNPQYANVKGAGIILEESTGVGECWQISGRIGHIAICLSETRVLVTWICVICLEGCPVLLCHHWCMLCVSSCLQNW